jgi:hypothetical protein
MLRVTRHSGRKVSLRAFQASSFELDVVHRRLRALALERALGLGFRDPHARPNQLAHARRDGFLPLELTEVLRGLVGELAHRALVALHIELCAAALAQVEAARRSGGRGQQCQAHGEEFLERRRQRHAGVAVGQLSRQLFVGHGDPQSRGILVEQPALDQAVDHHPRETQGLDVFAVGIGRGHQAVGREVVGFLDAVTADLGNALGAAAGLHVGAGPELDDEHEGDGQNRGHDEKLLDGGGHAGSSWAAAIPWRPDMLNRTVRRRGKACWPRGSQPGRCP